VIEASVAVVAFVGAGGKAERHNRNDEYADHRASESQMSDAPE